MMKNPLIKRIERLYYDDKRSMQDIADTLDKSLNFIRYHMQKNKMKRRNWSEATYVKVNRTEPFKIKKNLTTREKQLRALALGIFWNEGTNKNPISIRVSNSDPELLKVFVYFLRELCGVPNEKIKVSVIVSDFLKIKDAEDFWCRKLDLLPTQLGKTSVIKSNGNGIHKKRAPYGTATVCVYNTKLRKKIQSWVNHIAHVAQ